FKLNEGKYPTLGELNMLSKNSGLTVDYQIRNFVLLGDPALRLSYPENKVITTQINGHPVGTIKDTLNAFNHVTVSGIIQNTLGEKLTNFNGVVYPSVYDKKTITTTLGNDPGSYPATYNIQKSILYKGKVSVINGEFTFSFIVPKDISYNYGVGRISYYAEDGQTNANGYYENEHFIIGGTSNLILNDSKGPDMELYLNDTNFVFGGTTDENPVLIAHLNDISGINTAGNGIGHDIVAVIDDNTDRSVVLNDYYEADLDSYQTGKVRYPFAKLSDGMHTLKLKVWDIYNNSSEKIIEFIVAESGEIALTHVLNYPNPFTTNTSFYFEHNQSYCEMDVKIEIFTISGKLIKTIDKKIQTMGFRPDPIPWDGLDEFGDPIGKGVYIYKLKVKDENGKTAEKIEKLVIIR
ncbi:MAG TPA: type IX secretion system sortase PorU, partial [Bacteroidales bacterium]|nr:type IX secretion system sortase PorU [Bacteroidales bacterium]